jgi:hypothetical protein
VGGFVTHRILCDLYLECGQWNAWRGNSQLVSLSSTFIANTKSLTKLHIQVQCSESLLTEMLKLVPALEMLGLGVTSPHALSEKFFQEFVATEPSASSSHGMIGLQRLSNLTLSYKRWLRGPERKMLIPVFGDIVESCQERPFSLSLSCAKGGFWEVEGTVERFCGNKPDSVVLIGISSPRGIARVSPCIRPSDPCSFPFKEAEYLSVRVEQLSIDILSSPSSCGVEDT